MSDKAKIIAGTGTYSTSESIEITKMADSLGVDGIMIVTPYYSKPSQHGILRHFEEISKITDLPIMAYNIPGRTSTLIELETLQTLVDDIGIHSIKDAVGDFEFSKKQLELLKDKADIYSGNDNQTYDFVINGGVGVVSVASHVVGDEISEMISFAKDNDLEKAEEINMQLSNLFESIFEEPSPGPIKKILSESWEEVGEPLLPITTITPELANKIRDFYKKIKEN